MLAMVKIIKTTMLLGILSLSTLYILIAPSEWFGNLPYQKIDKVIHIFLFGIVTWVMAKTLPQLTIKGSVLLMITLALLSEVLQTLSTHRTGSIFDVVANLIGITLAVSAMNIKTTALTLTNSLRLLNNKKNETNTYIQNSN